MILISKVMDNEALDKLFALAKKANLDSGKDREVHVVELLVPYLKERPKDGGAWLLYGDSLRVIGRAKEAMDGLLNALELAPESKKPFICGRLGLLCSSYRSHEEAEKWFSRATASDVESTAWLWILRGTNLNMLGEFHHGIECLRKAVSLESEEKDEAFLNIGLAARAIGDYQEAISAARKALDINPDYEAAKRLLASVIDIEKTQEVVSAIVQSEKSEEKDEKESKS